MNASDAVAEMRRLSMLLDEGLKFLREQGREFAEAEADYRKAKALAWLNAPAGTVPATEAWVNGHTADDRKRRDLAEVMRQAALESVRSRRGQISALQTMLNADQEEAKFARTGPDWAA